MEGLGFSIKELLVNWGVAAQYLDISTFCVGLIVLLIVSIVAYLIIHKIVNVAVRRIVERTAVTWDDAFFNDSLLTSVCHLVPPILVYILFPILMCDFPAVVSVGEKVVLIYVVVMAVRAMMALFSSIYLASRQTRSFDGHSLKGLMQMLKIVAICVGLIIIVSILINKNPLIILSGLGASAAVLMLIFKDTIVGLVAGVQLSVNDMLKQGDWIQAPKHGVNGVVEDVSLTTVKVRNWDMTIVTVPPYSLVSESFQNWRGMQNSGGRRVMRSVNIDLNSVRFVTDEEMTQYMQQEWCKNFVAPVKKVVNLHLFRHYIEQYLSTHPDVNKNMLMMVRQLQSSNHGVPIELYFFTDTVEWVKYENIQAEIFDHIIAVAHDFDLRIFQSPSGLDINSL